MMQAERDQQAFDEAVDGHGGARIADGGPVGERVDTVLHGRPDHRQQRSQPDRRQGGHDGDEPLAGEEAQICRQRYLVVFVEHVGGQAAGQDTAEHAGFHGRDAHDGLGIDTPDPRHHAHGRQHDHVADGGGDGGHAVVLGEAQRHADREDQGQVGEDHVAGVLHQQRQDFRHPAEIGGADTQQQARDRQHGHRQHQGLADLLKEGEWTLGHWFPQFFLILFFDPTVIPRTAPAAPGPAPPFPAPAPPRRGLGIRRG